MNIAIIGSGYVGQSNAVLLAQNHSVIVLDIISEKIDLLNRFESSIDYDEIKDFLKKKISIL
jgi:UDPglucose 6-dehydrogenase